MKNIIKRIFIGVSIGLILMFARFKVYAYEWTVEGDEYINPKAVTITDYVSFGNMNISSFPASSSTISTDITFSSSAGSGSINSSYSNQYSQTRTLPIFYGAIDVKLTSNSLSFEEGKYYKIIVPMGYSSNIFSSLSNNVNEEIVLDSSTYSVSNSNLSIYSASLSFGVDNDMDSDTTFTKYLYFSIIFYCNTSFTTSSSNRINFYINSSNVPLTCTATALNTYTCDKPYLFKTNLNNTTSYYTHRFYKPFLYQTIPTSIIPDPNASIHGVTSDIKSQIDDIIDGTFSGDFDFSSINTGDSPFGDSDYTLQDLLLVPINFVKSIATNYDICSGVSIPIPGFNSSFTLPCMTSFMSGIFGSNFVAMIQSILGCVVCIRILGWLYNDILNAIDPKYLCKYNQLI